VVIHVQAIKNLAPADYSMIEKEHARLNRFLSDLRDTCCNLDNQLGCQSCSSEKLASCRGRLPSFFFDIIDLVGKHFYNEESIMLSRPHVTVEYEYFRIHRQAHAKIMQELNAIVGESFSLAKQGNLSEGYRQFYKKVSVLLEEHDRSFDDPFIQSTIG
jgi:hemerythrin